MKYLLACALAAMLTLAAAAQDSLPTADRYLMPQGRWAIGIDWNPYTWAWTYLPHRQLRDASGFGVFNLGLGAEWAYRDNRSWRLAGHAALIGNNEYYLFERFETTPPRRTVNQVSIDLTHQWYLKRWTIGIGPSLEWRWTHYCCCDFDKYLTEHASNDKLVKRATETHERYGPRDFDQTHVSLGLMASVAYRILPNFSLGVMYAPRVTCRSMLTYKLPDCKGGEVPQLSVKTATGHVDHQLSIMANWRIDLTKRPKKSQTAIEHSVSSQSSASPQSSDNPQSYTVPRSYIDSKGRRQSTGVVMPKKTQ